MLEEVALVPVGAPAAAARLALDGEVAGWVPVAATAAGVTWAEGSFGAERATADESAAVGDSFFHQAHRGPDWQPKLTVAINPAIVSRTTTRLMLYFLNGDGRGRIALQSARFCDAGPFAMHKYCHG